VPRRSTACAREDLGNSDDPPIPVSTTSSMPSSSTSATIGVIRARWSRRPVEGVEPSEPRRVRCAWRRPERRVVRDAAARGRADVPRPSRAATAPRRAVPDGMIAPADRSGPCITDLQPSCRHLPLERPTAGRRVSLRAGHIHVSPPRPRADGAHVRAEPVRPAFGSLRAGRRAPLGAGCPPRSTSRSTSTGRSCTRADVPEADVLDAIARLVGWACASASPRDAWPPRTGPLLATEVFTGPARVPQRRRRHRRGRGRAGRARDLRR
jgi:hypothetical protein